MLLHVLTLLFALLPAGQPATCTYDTWTWSVVARRAVHHRHVAKPYAQLNEEEKASDWSVTGCTMCREDQEKIALPGVRPAYICKFYAPRVQQALQEALKAGAEIESLVGYRVGRSGGPVVRGKRTQYGWHAFGEALDINSNDNGLYAHCKRDTPAPHNRAELGRCRRRLGGYWLPETQPTRSLTPDGAIVSAFRRILGWHWGGERTDTMKDLMHVSPDGY